MNIHLKSEYNHKNFEYLEIQLYGAVPYRGPNSLQERLQFITKFKDPIQKNVIKGSYTMSWTDIDLLKLALPTVKRELCPTTKRRMKLQQTTV